MSTIRTLLLGTLALTAFSACESNRLVVADSSGRRVANARVIERTSEGNRVYYTDASGEVEHERSGALTVSKPGYRSRRIR